MFVMEIAGRIEEAWFDSAAIFESDCSDEDFQSVPDGTAFLVFNLLFQLLEFCFV